MRAHEIFEAPKPATESDIRSAISTLVSLMRKVDSRATYRTNHDDPNYFDVRYWGSWEVPQGEEDDGDYDWKVPTDETEAKLKSLVDQTQKLVPNVRFSYSYEEKEWFSFTARSAV